MNPNPSTVTPPQSTKLTLHILLERTETGKAIASVFELPNCRVEASTDKQAIESLKKMVASHLEKIEVIPLEIQILQSQHTEKPWMKFAGVFKDDPDFDTVQQYIQDYRQKLDEENTEVKD